MHSTLLLEFSPLASQLISSNMKKKKLLPWIKALYSTPTASVKYAVYFSTSFSIYRGTRLGLPLSPALFILALEPLSITLRADQNVTGVSYAGHDFKPSLFFWPWLSAVSWPAECTQWLPPGSSCSGRCLQAHTPSCEAVTARGFSAEDRYWHCDRGEAAFGFPCSPCPPSFPVSLTG